MTIFVLDNIYGFLVRPNGSGSVENSPTKYKTKGSPSQLAVTAQNLRKSLSGCYEVPRSLAVPDLQLEARIRKLSQIVNEKRPKLSLEIFSRRANRLSILSKRSSEYPEVVELRQRAIRAVKSGIIPKLTTDGCGGVYIVDSMDGSNAIGIFKPRSEEFMGPENPRDYSNEGAVVGVTDHPVQKGFKIGNGALMERAAFLLDAAYDHFSDVPATCLTRLSVDGSAREKEGSLQAFVPSISSAEDMGTGHFDISEIQKIGILDMRLFNTDRHAGNILLTEKKMNGKYAMVPIDHGFCLPSYKHLDSATFDWLHWSQAKFPFEPEALDHIEALNVEEDAKLLRSLGIDEDSITTLRICTITLKVGAKKGLSLFDIGSIMQREGDFSAPSVLENLIESAVSELDTKLTSPRAIGDAIVASVTEGLEEALEKRSVTKPRSISWHA